MEQIVKAESNAERLEDAVSGSDVVFSAEDVLQAIERSKQLEVFNATLVRQGRSALDSKKLGRVDAFTMDPRDLKIVPMFNTRIPSAAYRAHIDDLKAKIRKHGYLKNHPMSIFIQKIDQGTVEFWVTDGNTRLAAVLELLGEGVNIHGVTVVLEPDGTTLSDITARLVINNTAKPLTDLEIGLVLKRLISYGHALEQAAEMINLKVNDAKNLLVLIGAPDEIRAMVIAEEVSTTLALQYMKKHGAKAVDVLKTGLDAAKGLGKRKVTQKTLDRLDPGALMKRVVKKNADRMHVEITRATVITQELRQAIDDPALANLSVESRKAIQAALDHLSSLSTLVGEIQSNAQDLVTDAEKAAAEAKAASANAGDTSATSGNDASQNQEDAATAVAE